MESFIDWAISNWILVVLAIVIVILAIRSQYKKKRYEADNPKEEESNHREFLTPPQFTQTLDLSSTLLEQRKIAEQELKAIQSEGKRIVTDERDLEKYYRQQRNILVQKKQNLELKYATWTNHWNNIQQMIDNQKRMEHEIEPAQKPPVRRGRPVKK